MDILLSLKKQRLSGRPMVAEVRKMLGEQEFSRVCEYEGRNFSERLYLYMGNKPTGCWECGMTTTFRTLFEGYSPYCSRKCAAKSTSLIRCKPKILLHIHPVKLEFIFVEHRKISDSNAFLARIKKQEPKIYQRFLEHKESLRTCSAQTLFHMFVTNKIPVCECGKQTAFRSVTEGYRKNCSPRCLLGEKLKRKYEDPAKLKHFLDSREKTWMGKYGFTHPSHSKSSMTARKITCMETYGKPWAMQNKAVSRKSIRNATKREVISISGKDFPCSGYEKYGVEYLAKKYKIKDINTRTEYMPKIRYSFRGRWRWYMPDIRVKNLIVEVKSTYTAGLTKRNVQKDWMLASKGNAVRKAGFNFLCLIFDPKGKLLLASKILKSHAYYRKKLNLD